ncbi:MAG: TIGR03118 family protein [Acidobacteriaceae bacterium]
MQSIGIRSYRRLLAAFSLAVVVASASYAQAQVKAQHYTQKILVADHSGVAGNTDANLVNPWGLSRSSGSPWWVSDNGTGVSTLYDGTGKAAPLIVTIPPANSSSKTGTPTGTVFNGGTGFALASGKPALFLFVTEDGTVSGWNPGVNPTHAVIKVNENGKSVFKGATIANVGLSSFLYVADFRQGHLQVFDSSFHHVSAMEALFKDDRLPSGYAPFNVQNIGGDVYVTFAVQDSAKHDEVDGAGLGYVDVFTPTGTLLRRFDHGSWLNAPWGLALASGDFGVFSHDLLVGQFGSGTIQVYDPLTGHLLGHLSDASNRTIQHDGLWALSFGSDGGSGPATTLYFSAGTNHEQDGLFGAITAIDNAQGNHQ